MKIRFESNSSNQGFSLIELIVVLIITAILAQLGFVSFNRYQRKTKAFAAKTALMNVRRECETNRDLGLDTNFTLLNPNGYLINSRRNNNCLGEENSGYVVANPSDLDNFPRYFYDFNNGTIFCMNPSGVNFFPECLGTQLNKSKKSNLVKKGKLSFKTNEISASVEAPKSVELADMDGDGDMDFIVVGHPGTTWFENDGSKNFTAHKIPAGANGGYGVSVADMDGDGDMDIITSGNGLTWLKNDGNSNYEKIDIPTGWSSSWGSGREIALKDMDGDGDMDIIGTKNGESQVTWYENNGQPNPSFNAQVIDTNANGAQDIHIEDMDGDGDFDVIVATQDDDSVDWYENVGGSNPSWKKNHVTKNINAANGIFVGDMDGDGDMDILSASQDDNRVAWYENNGRTNPSFKQLDIAKDRIGADDRDPKSVGQAMDVRAADMDGDGDLDVLTTNYNGYYHLYKNDGDSNPNFEQTLFGQRRGYMVQPYEMDHGDIDGDGDLDVISISNYENKVYWYENE